MTEVAVKSGALDSPLKTLIRRSITENQLPQYQWLDQQRAKNEQNYPVHLSSEASQFLNIEKSTPLSNSKSGRTDLEVAGLKLTDLDNATQLYMVNDHPAICFPNLKAPNSINMIYEAGIEFDSPTLRLENDQDLSLFVEYSNLLSWREK
ncbi:hypothetical protein ACHWQZ_G001463 [Mnemiopsis leidyi]